ncbi:fatty acid desaturase 6 isoform X2 [Vombatus ursinus]|uniref:fatty acid desaturase 6 isoform X2 n=1 Tax=Vombatus ursinus TaxID=29139 RepID=UPI000FFCF88D|nr:fatty acid desaturase 6 isoform X2 [Vombatus ursinus]
MWDMEPKERRMVSGNLGSSQQTAKETPVSPTCNDSCRDPGHAGVRKEGMLMGELEALVQEMVKTSSWWERHGLDWFILALNFLALPLGFLCLRSQSTLVCALGIIILGVVHHTFTVKGSHLASHGALSNSKHWSRFWVLFFVEVCTSFTAEQATHGHVKLHHGYTNVVGLGDSSTWKVPILNRYVYMFFAPLMLPIITPLVALGLLRKEEPRTVLRTLCLMSLGLFSHYWLLIKVSGFQSPGFALLCMLITRGLLAHPYIHVNIFQVKPVVSQFLQRNHLPYNEDSYLSRLWLFLSRYEELMVHAPPITDLVGLQ